MKVVWTALSVGFGVVLLLLPGSSNGNGFIGFFFQLINIIFHQFHFLLFFLDLFFQLSKFFIIFLHIFLFLLVNLLQLAVELHSSAYVLAPELLLPGPALQGILLGERPEQLQLLGGEGPPDGLGGDLASLAEAALTSLEEAGAALRAHQTAAAGEVNPARVIERD